MAGNRSGQGNCAIVTLADSSNHKLSALMWRSRRYAASTSTRSRATRGNIARPRSRASSSRATSDFPGASGASGAAVTVVTGGAGFASKVGTGSLALDLLEQLLGLGGGGVGGELVDDRLKPLARLRESVGGDVRLGELQHALRVRRRRGRCRRAKRRRRAR